MRVGVAQINTTVGDLDGNAERILKAYRQAVDAGAEIVITPELAITGYPPQDLVFKSRFVPKSLEQVSRLHQEIGEVPLVVGYVDFNPADSGNPFMNAAAVLEQGKPIRKIFKTLLPTYDVFDEDRYFQPATENSPIEIAGIKIGITICEDIWPPGQLYRQLYDVDPVDDLVAQGAEIILNLSASPYHSMKQANRIAMLVAVAQKHAVPIIYCNAVGGNDQLIFDGQSVVVNAAGEQVFQGAAFQEEISVIDLDAAVPFTYSPPETAGELYHALTLGLRDYFRKCGFSSAVIGLSGGIDSAVTAVIAAEALGADNVTGVTMPSEFSSSGSVSDSEHLARNLGIHYHEVPIAKPVGAFMGELDGFLGGTESDTTEENIQPRVRATILMALSNKFAHLLLTTGNKSELAVGYCTLYGDMAGGLAVISDVPKLIVYEIARWINRNEEIIPWPTIEKPPSAELKPDQKDQDTLPPYETLDPILQRYVEEHQSGDEIVAAGFDREIVQWVIRRVDLNEYKREQAAPGLRVTSKAFGFGRRMPVAQRYID